MDFPTPRPRDWYVLGQMFDGPYYFDDPLSPNGASLGVQLLALMDVASTYFLHHEVLKKVPGNFTASEILEFLQVATNKHGWPKIGIIISPSVWRSSEKLEQDPDISPRLGILKKYGIKIPAMAQTEADVIDSSLSEVGVEVDWEYDH